MNPNISNCDTFTVSLRLRHPNEDLRNLARELEWSIDRVWIAGDPIKRKDGTTTGSIYSDSYLLHNVLSSQEYSSFKTHLDQIAARLHSQKAILHFFVERGGSVELLVGWFFNEISGLEIDSTILALLGESRVALSIMAYGEGDSSDSPS